MVEVTLYEPSCMPGWVGGCYKDAAAQSPDTPSPHITCRTSHESTVLTPDLTQDISRDYTFQRALPVLQVWHGCSEAN